MTISSTATSSGPYAATADTTFAVDFYSISETEIEVRVDDVIIPSSGWTFTRDADGTGEVVLDTAVTGEVYIYSKPGFLQPTDFQRHGAFFPDQFNNPLDRLAAQDLFLRDETERLEQALADALVGTIPSGIFTADVVEVDGGGSVQDRLNALDRVLTIAALSAGPAVGSVVVVAGYHSANDGGGGVFYWDATGSKILHDGGTVIDPDRAFPADWTNQTQLDTWFAAGVGGLGVWRRDYPSDDVHAVWFGLKGDYNHITGAGTDDARAINKALGANFRKVILPARSIRIVSQSVNLSYKFAGTVLEGTAGFKIAGAYTGTVLAGDTGVYPVIDLLGSQGVVVKNLAIISALTTPSRCGISIMRATDSQYAQFNVLDRLSIDITTAATAYTNKGSVGINNVAAEIFTLRDCYVKGDTGVFFGANNYFGMTSQFGTQGGPTSCSTFKFEGENVVHSHDPVGTPLRLDSVAFVEGPVYSAQGAVYPAGSYGFIMTGACFSVNIQVFVEFALHFGRVGSLFDCDIKVYGSFNVDRYIDTDGTFTSMHNVNFGFKPTMFGGVAPAYWLANSPGDVCRNVNITASIDPTTDFMETATGNRYYCSFKGGTIDILSTDDFSSTGEAYLTGSVFVTTLSDYADDAAAAVGGVVVGELYRTGSIVKVRVA